LYPAHDCDLAALGEVLATDLGKDGYEVTQTTGAGATGPWRVLEVRRPSTLIKQAMGQAAALKVWLASEEQGLRVQVGTERIEDKAAGAVEWLLATPALVTEGYAAFQRAHLDERVFRTVEAWLAATSPTPPDRKPAPVPDGLPCPACKKPIPLGGRFCAFCGHDSHASATLKCAGCGESLPLGATFCSSCGARVEKRGSFCAGCGETLGAGARFCPSCGKPSEAKAT
jgi:hypothetical protein